MISILLIIFFITLPVAVVYTGIIGGQSSTWDHITNNLLLNYSSNTFRLLIGTALGSLLFGTLTGWLIAAHEFPLRKQLSWLLILPLTVPTYIAAYAYSGLFEYSGLFSIVLNGLDLSSWRPEVRNLNGATLVLTAVLYPYVYIASRVSFQADSGRLFEAARMLGSSGVSNLLRIVLPVSRPAIVAGMSLVVMETLNEYGAVKYFGVNTMTTGIFRAWFSLEDLQAAINLSAMLMSFVFFLIIVERWQRGKRKYKTTQGEKPIGQYQLKRYMAIGATVFCMIPVAFGFVLPTIQLIYWSFFTFKKVVSDDFLQLIFNSFSLSAIAALGCVAVSILLAYAVRLTRTRKSEILGQLASLGYSIPGAALAIGIMITTLFVDRSLFQPLFSMNGLILTGSVGALIYAYVIRYLAVSYNPVDSGFNKVTFSLTEVSRTLGASPVRSLISVNLPLLKPVILSALLLVFVDVMKELPLTLILRPFNFETLATRAFRYANDEMVPESGPVSLIIILASLIPIIFINRRISVNE